MRQFGAALERTDLERDTPSPPDDVIHPLQTRLAEEDDGAGQGYIDKTSSGDAVER